MSQQKRTIWDDLVELGREIAEKIDETLHPEKKRQPARVPVPVRGNRQQQQDPYNDYN